MDIYNNNILLYKKGNLYFCDDNKNITLIYKLNTSIKKRIILKSRILTRLFHIGPRKVIFINENKLLIVMDKTISIYNLKNKTSNLIYKAYDGFSTPLNVILCKNKYIALFGDYGPNNNKSEVRLYGILNSEKIEVLYTFPKNSIRHIHNVIESNVCNEYILFTGDNEEQAGIYSYSLIDNYVKKICIGSNDYRAVQGYEIGDNLLYASDYADKENYIYKLNKETLEVEKIFNLSGSCIYGSKYKDSFLLSTTIEPTELYNTKIAKYLNNKLGIGIKNKYASLLYINKEKIYELLCIKKDIFTMKLFGYGSFTFPYRQKDNKIFVNINCLKGDNKILVIDEMELKK